ncbi:Mannosylfructose-phosphate synthase [Thiorhodovibrio winogradskyi]|uniref:Mannosylfructose-phosphate synthase n=1 Tax=Thiorhodovibrio winogradskyi TaxID=77007 RepID=A0ABZ0S5Q6_9GAMM|nr:glycosyltransferase family 1 protein [Thiorhodovibrio winogradskyi]
MKLLLDIDALRPPLTGIGRYTLELARRLPRAPGVAEVRYLRRLLCLPAGVPSNPRQGSPAPVVRALRDRVAAVQGPCAGAGALRVLYRRLLEIRQRRLLRALKDHVFLAPNYFLPPVAGLGVAVFHDLSLIKHPEWHPCARVALSRYMLARTLERAHHIIVDAEAIRGELIEQTGYPAERVSAIPLGVDPAFHPRAPEQLTHRLASYRLSPGAYVLCVATIEPRKNLPTLIDAHACLPEALRLRYPLVLVGAPGWNSAASHQRIQRAEQAGQLRYLRYVAESDLPSLVAGARLAAQPSHYEGFGLPALEAMASGVPLVTSTCPTLLELTGNLALAVDPLDTQALTAALRQGLEDDGWRAEIGARALERARCYTWDACIARTVETLAAVRRHSPLDGDRRGIWPDHLKVNP